MNILEHSEQAPDHALSKNHVKPIPTLLQPKEVMHRVSYGESETDAVQGVMHAQTNNNGGRVNENTGFWETIEKKILPNCIEEVLQNKPTIDQTLKNISKRRQTEIVFHLVFIKVTTLYFELELCMKPHRVATWTPERLGLILG